jgi:hypothetical protein
VGDGEQIDMVRETEMKKGCNWRCWESEIAEGPSRKMEI